MWYWFRTKEYLFEIAYPKIIFSLLLKILFLIKNRRWYFGRGRAIRMRLAKEGTVANRASALCVLTDTCRHILELFSVSANRGRDPWQEVVNTQESKAGVCGQWLSKPAEFLAYSPKTPSPVAARAPCVGSTCPCASAWAWQLPPALCPGWRAASVTQPVSLSLRSLSLRLSHWWNTTDVLHRTALGLSVAP